MSLIARDPGTGAFGMVVCSSSPAVAARCIHLRAGTGAVASQNVTNPQLGPLGLDGLDAGLTPEEVIRSLETVDPWFSYRQVTVVDSSGRTAWHSGSETLGTNAARSHAGAVAAGNMLASATVIDAMLDRYLNSHAPTFEERLLIGLRGAVEAGGEEGPVRSAGIAVVHDKPWRVTDLRVDDAENPVDDLTRLIGLWLPVKSAYLERAVNPTAAPSYGVPGDR